MKKILHAFFIFLIASVIVLFHVSQKIAAEDIPLSDLAVDLKEAAKDTDPDTIALRQEVTQSEDVVGGVEDGDPVTPPEQISIISQPTDDELTESSLSLQVPTAENSENLNDFVLDQQTGQELPVDQGELMQMLPDNNTAPEETPTPEPEEAKPAQEESVQNEE